MQHNLDSAIAAVAGLGYVGQPLAEAFARTMKVIGFDINAAKIERLKQGNHNPNLTLTTDAKELRTADFVSMCVPTPVTRHKEPDLTDVISVARVVGQNLKKGAVAILESTVYPGVTEDIVKPILEAESGMKCGTDFKIAYSPERVNPGDDEHTIDKITKIVSGMDEETAERVAHLYQRAAGKIFVARNIKTAEAAKLIENIQRDLNIALMNELSLIFEKLGLRTEDVLDAAATKWNFHRYLPGLVGGHCIPVVPYYLVYKARELGYHSQVILAGRAINDSMPKHVAEMAIKALNDADKVIKRSRVLIMGLTYKEDVPDIRESPVPEMARELKDYGAEVLGFDPLLDPEGFKEHFAIKLLKSLDEARKDKVDAIILAVTHSAFRNLGLKDLKALQNSAPVLIDVRGMFNYDEAQKAGFYYRTL
ncbi:MAG: nucleotide sugar dehydrogenase [Dehalococcoidales bacterium]|nr:nucleotide sugar dehydrogenase [Dehalococcoidales bacterium]